MVKPCTYSTAKETSPIILLAHSVIVQGHWALTVLQHCAAIRCRYLQKAAQSNEICCKSDFIMTGACTLSATLYSPNRMLHLAISSQLAKHGQSLPQRLMVKYNNTVMAII